MDNFLNKKIQSIRMIKAFMYNQKLKSLKIFSKQYFFSVLYSMYEKNDSRDFCFTFADFNKFRKLNETYSYEVGDKALYSSIQIIKKIFPKNTNIARIAGDEFTLLNEDLTKKHCKKYIEQVNPTIEANKNSTYGLSVTMSSSDSNAYENFEDLFLHSEIDVVAKKRKHSLDTSHAPEYILKEKIKENLRNYFDYYRINSSKQITLSAEYFQILRDSIINVVSNTLEVPDSNLSLYESRLHQSISDLSINSHFLNIPKDSAKKIHLLATSEIIDEKLLNAIPQQDLNKVIAYLIRDPLTNQYSKEFLEKIIIPKFKHCSGNARLLMFDLAHMKLSNDIIGHSNTDSSIKIFFGDIIKELSKNIDYNNKSNFLVCYGGKLVSIEQEPYSCDTIDIEKITQKAQQHQRILDIVPASIICPSSEIQNSLDKLTEECEEKKVEIKLSKIYSKETIIALNKALSDSMNYYLNNIPNPHDIRSKSFLINSIFEGLTNVISEKFANTTINLNSNSNEER